MATVSGWWPVSEIEITSRQWPEMRESVRLATEQGKALVTAAGVSLVWHPAPDSLDAAWAEAEAALRDGTIRAISIGQYPPGTESAGTWAAVLVYEPEYFGNGATPAAALRALAAKLREVPR